MIGQYLSNTNESATVSISQKILELNKALPNFPSLEFQNILGKMQNFLLFCILEVNMPKIFWS